MSLPRMRSGRCSAAANGRRRLAIARRGGKPRRAVAPEERAPDITAIPGTPPPPAKPSQPAGSRPSHPSPRICRARSRSRDRAALAAGRAHPCRPAARGDRARTLAAPRTAEPGEATRVRVGKAVERAEGPAPRPSPAPRRRGSHGSSACAKGLSRSSRELGDQIAASSTSASSTRTRCRIWKTC
jgi:hypothetical protein